MHGSLELARRPAAGQRAFSGPNLASPSPSSRSRAQPAPVVTSSLGGPVSPRCCPEALSGELADRKGPSGRVGGRRRLAAGRRWPPASPADNPPQRPVLDRGQSSGRLLDAGLIVGVGVCVCALYCGRPLLWPLFTLARRLAPSWRTWLLSRQPSADQRDDCVVGPPLASRRDTLHPVGGRLIGAERATIIN